MLYFWFLNLKWFLCVHCHDVSYAFKSQTDRHIQMASYNNEQIGISRLLTKTIEIISPMVPTVEDTK